MQILGIGKVGKNSSKSIDKVYFVDGLKFNLLSVSHLCDKGNHIVFDKEKCIVKNSDIEDLLITPLRHDNVYALNTNEIAAQDFMCLK